MLIRRWTLLLALLLCGTWTLQVQADDAAKEKEQADSAAEKTDDAAEKDGEAEPADDGEKFDVKEFQAKAGKLIGEIARSMDSDPDEAERKLDELEKFLADQEADSPNAQRIKRQAKQAVKLLRSRLTLSRTSLEDMRKALKEEPNAENLQKYIAKVSQEVGSEVRKDPKAAEKQLTEAKEFLKSIADETEDEDLKQQIGRSELQFARIERAIASEMRLAELVGKDAAPLVENIEVWANGEPLTAEDLKGKVVLLDFWAVWCGPCIATFPHLREWNEKYADDGLVIVGLTRFYNMKWDEEAGRATRSKDPVEAADEVAMLGKFAEEHSLKHPFGVQKNRTLSEFYAVSGIPHVVLIDRDGKVRLVKVGAGEANAHAIEEMIHTLIPEAKKSEESKSDEAKSDEGKEP